MLFINVWINETDALHYDLSQFGAAATAACELSVRIRVMCAVISG